MSQHTESPSFRYSNDNRDLSDSVFTKYPSQQTISPTSTKGQRNYYSNDNRGYYANSNRSNLSVVDPGNNTQYPNQNKPQELILFTQALAGSTVLDVGTADVSSLSIGDTVILSQGTAIEEEGVIAGFASIILEDPLQFTHPIGTPIIKKVITDTTDNEWLTEFGDKVMTQSGDSFVWNLGGSSTVNIGAIKIESDNLLLIESGGVLLLDN